MGGCGGSAGSSVGIAVRPPRRAAPHCPVPAAVGGTEPLGRGETLASTHRSRPRWAANPQRSASGRREGVFPPCCAQPIPALGFSPAASEGRSTGAVNPGPSSLTRQSRAQVGARGSRGTGDAGPDPGRYRDALALDLASLPVLTPPLYFKISAPPPALPAAAEGFLG